MHSTTTIAVFAFVFAVFVSSARERLPSTYVTIETAAADDCPFCYIPIVNSVYVKSSDANITGRSKSSLTTHWPRQLMLSSLVLTAFANELVFVD